MARAMEFGWRRVPPASGAASPPPTAPVEQPETTLLAARMAVAPAAARRALIDALIAGLKADGVWAQLDWLVVLAAHDAQAARLNWRNPGKALRTVNAPAFTVDRGYAGDGATSYLDFGEPLNASGNLFARDAASLGVWCNAGMSVGEKGQIGVFSAAAPYVYVNATGVGAEGFGVNQSTYPTVTGPGTRLGHRAAVRSGPATLKSFYGGAPRVTLANPSTGVPAANGTLCIAGSNRSADRIAAGYTGGALGDEAVAALHGRLSAYLSAIGAE